MEPRQRQQKRHPTVVSWVFFRLSHPAKIPAIPSLDGLPKSDALKTIRHSTDPYPFHPQK